MYFCERCNRLVEHGRCSLCGIRKLRKVKDTDFCYLTTVSDSGKNYFEETLKANAIPVTMFGEGVSIWSLGSTQFKVYVPYGYYDQAKEIYNLLFGNGE